MTFLMVLLAILATYRLAHMVAYEDGPFDILLSLRTWVALRSADTWIDRGLNCPLCSSFWLAWGIVLLPSVILLALGVAGGVLVLHTLLNQEARR